MYSWLYHIGSDKILLKEKLFFEENKTKYDIGWKWKTFHSYSNSKFSRGVSILFKENLDIEVNNLKRTEEDGRKILFNITLNGNTFSIINIYAPNDELKKCDFCRRLISLIIKNYTNENIILCRDFNCQLDRKEVKSVKSLQ